MTERTCITCKSAGAFSKYVRYEPSVKTLACFRIHALIGTPVNTMCIDERSNASADSCGPEGKFWEAKE